MYSAQKNRKLFNKTDLSLKDGLRSAFMMVIIYAGHHIYGGLKRDLGIVKTS